MALSSENEILDLVDVALLLNYERCATEPRFRNAKLRDVVFPDVNPKTYPSHTVMAFNRENATASEVPDNPSNMLPTRNTDADERVYTLSSKQLETIYYQARAHDACYACIFLLQSFFDLFPADTPIRVRHGPRGKSAGDSYVTSIRRRSIIEMTLLEPRGSTTTLVSPEQTVYVSGNEKTMLHAVVGFARQESEKTEVMSILDLSSMQFGDLARGPGAMGQAPFALDMVDEFYDRVEKIAAGKDDSQDNVCSRSVRAHMPSGY